MFALVHDPNKKIFLYFFQKTMEVQVKVLDFMTKKIITILRDQNYQEALNLMLGNDIKFVSS